MRIWLIISQMPRSRDSRSDPSVKDVKVLFRNFLYRNTFISR